MIKTLSPYYISIPWVAPLSGLTASKFTLKVYVWNGLKSAVPVNPIYEVTKDNVTNSTGTEKINVSYWISDFIDFAPKKGVTTELLNGDNQFWVKWETVYTTSNPTDLTTPTNINTELYTRGYSYGLDGENVNVSSGFLIPVIDYRVNREGFFNIPILIDETIVTLGSLLITNISKISGTSFECTFNQTGNLSTIYYRYRLSSEPDWTTGFVGVETTTVSPFNITLPNPVEYIVQLFSYDLDNATDIFSNDYLINAAL